MIFIFSLFQQFFHREPSINFGLFFINRNERCVVHDVMIFLYGLHDTPVLGIPQRLGLLKSERRDACIYRTNILTLKKGFSCSRNVECFRQVNDTFQFMINAYSCSAIMKFASSLTRRVCCEGKKGKYFGMRQESLTAVKIRKSSKKDENVKSKRKRRKATKLILTNRFQSVVLNDISNEAGKESSQRKESLPKMIKG